jgi:hypothetical protein
MMQTFEMLLSLALLVGVTGQTPSGQTAVERAPVAARASAGHADLELVARVAGTAPKHSWWPLSMEVDLVNRSTTTSHAIVLPGDGSNAGWREPHVYFTAEVLAEDGAWVATPMRGGGRCGNYDPYWLDEIVRLAPGASQRLGWMGPLPTLPEHGRVRVRAHYAYNATPPGREWSDTDRSPPPGGLGEMEGVAPFELVSAPIELTLAAPDSTRRQIESDLALELTRESSTPAYSWEPQRLSVKLVNRSSSRTHRVVRPVFTRDRFGGEPGVHAAVEVERLDGVWKLAERLLGGFYDGPIDFNEMRSPQPDWRPRVVDLAPGQSLDFSLPASRLLYDFTSSRAARVSLSYEYWARPVRDAQDRALAAPASLGEMASTPRFRLQSNTVTWPVHSPLEFELTLRTDRDPRHATSLADCLRVVLRNRSDETIEISSARAPAKLEVSADGLMGEHGAAWVRCGFVLPQLAIAPHAELSLLENPSIVARTPQMTVPRPPYGQAPGAQALLHRAGWIHAFSATWPVTGK